MKILLLGNRLALSYYEGNMKPFLVSWFKYAKKSPEAQESIASLVSDYKMERRRNARILYPPWGDLDYLPKIFIQGQLATPYDISMGGLGLVPRASEDTGATLDVELSWPKESLTLHTRARLIASYKHSLHLQFDNPPLPLKKHLESLLLPSLNGQRFQLVQLKNAPFQCVEEVAWINPQSEIILLQEGFGVFRFTLGEIHVEKNIGIFSKTSKERFPLRNSKKLAQLLICLNSIPRQTHELYTLQDYIYSYWKNLNHE